MIGYYTHSESIEPFSRFKYDNTTYVCIPYTFYSPNGILILQDIQAPCNCKTSLHDVLEIENFKEIDVDSYTQYIARSMPVKARYVSDGAVFYVFPEQCDEIIDKLNNKQYEYYELRYSDIFGINLNSFQIIGFEPTHLVCIGIGEASFQEKDENNTLDISVNKNVYSFPVKIPFTSLFKLRINCIL